ncbi:hypothetical protein BDK51DRAFT_29274 [Blyttiomyces helicus]|uniref:Uncharacterized protein n=1 Tax=Blyttiomyces helicus TaxID=388810 RepID=A0A4P9WGP9_9FUNG|nr:hypothetical protein BDK51DRAFT_29274 [Blyttiomyces helicus]|eukprot:RKO91979.1 hypothetical protein BDK51DRAFT_29274 [Blyttiomyces helicus]
MKALYQKLFEPDGFTGNRWCCSSWWRDCKRGARQPGSPPAPTYDKVSDLEEEKYEGGKEPLQFEKKSPPAAVYDGGVRVEEEVRKRDRPEKVFPTDGKKVAEGLINGQVTNVKKIYSN